MSEYEWPAQDYAIGSSIQATVADMYIDQLKLNLNATVLDIGCGNGAYSTKILDKVPHGQVLGIDSSENMLVLARDVITDYPYFSIERNDVESMSYVEQFDCITSFWCLQWTQDILHAFDNMARALKPGGQLFALFPSGDDAFITNFYKLRDSGRFSCLEGFSPPMNYAQMDDLATKLNKAPFNKLEIKRPHQAITLPSFDTFRRFVNGIGFYQGQVEEHELVTLNNAMCEEYFTDCHRKHGGQAIFDFSVYLVTAIK